MKQIKNQEKEDLPRYNYVLGKLILFESNLELYLLLLPVLFSFIKLQVIKSFILFEVGLHKVVNYIINLVIFTETLAKRGDVKRFFSLLFLVFFVYFILSGVNTQVFAQLGDGVACSYDAQCNSGNCDNETLIGLGADTGSGGDVKECFSLTACSGTAVSACGDTNTNPQYNCQNDSGLISEECDDYSPGSCFANNYCSAVCIYEDLTIPTLDLVFANKSYSLNSELGASILEWTDNAANATKFGIYRSTDNATFTNIGNSSNVTRYVDDNTQDNTLYFYKIAAGHDDASCFAGNSTVLHNISADRTGPETPRHGLVERAVALFFDFDDFNQSTTVVDKSAFGNDGVVVDGAWAVAYGYRAEGMGFDGVDDYIIVPHDTTLEPSSMTMEAWFYIDSGITPETYGVIIDKAHSSHVEPYYNYHMRIDNIDAASDITVCIIVGAWGGDCITTTNVLAYDTWYYIATTFDGTDLKLYIDGVFNASRANSGSITYSQQDLYIGAFKNLATGNFPGKIDQPRILDRALLADEISLYYNQTKNNFSNTYVDLSWTDQDYDDGLVLYMPFEENSKDWSDNKLDPTLIGAPTFVDGRYGNSVNLDGNDAYNITQNLTQFDSGEMTITLWFNKSNINAGAQYFMDGRGVGGNWWLLQDYAVGCTDANGNICYDGRVEVLSSDISNNEWYHVAVTDSSTESKIYLDGVLMDTGTGEATSPAPGWTIGTRFTRSGYFVGNIDDLRVYNRTLTQREIIDVMQSGLIRKGIHRAAESNATFEPVGGIWDDFFGTNLGSNDNWFCSSQNCTVKNSILNVSPDTGGAIVVSSQNFSGPSLVEWRTAASSSGEGYIAIINSTSTSYAAFSFGTELCGLSSPAGNYDCVLNDEIYHDYKIIIDETDSRLYIDDVLVGSTTEVNSDIMPEYFVRAAQQLTTGAWTATDYVRITPLISDTNYTDEGTNVDNADPSEATGLSSTSHSTSVWSNDTTVDITWTAASDPANDTIYYYIASYDDEGNRDKRMTQYVVNDELASNNLNVVSLSENNKICTNSTTCITLDKGETGSFTAAQLQTDTRIVGKGPFSTSSSSSVAGAMTVPSWWRGTLFAYAAVRDVQNISVYAFEDDTYVEFYNGSGTLRDNTTLDAREVRILTYDLENNVGFTVNSSKPILAYHDADSDNDFFPFHPATTDWYSVGSGTLRVVCAEDNTVYDVYDSDGTSSTGNTCDKGGYASHAGAGSEGSAPSSRVIVKSGSVGVIAVGDGDGGDATTFLPVQDLSYVYALPAAAQYIALSTVSQNTTCKVYESDALIETQTSTGSGGSLYPGHILFNATTYSAGTVISCNGLTHAYFETSADSLEVNLIGIPVFDSYKNRPYADDFIREIDVSTGIDGYDVACNQTSDDHTGSTIDKEESVNTHTCTFPESDSNYFHIVSADKAGNWDDTSADLGPFYIDLTWPHTCIVEGYNHSTEYGYGINNVFYYNNRTAADFSINVTATDDDSGIHNVSFPDTMSVGINDSSYQYMHTYSWTTTDSGNYSKLIYCRDNVGYANWTTVNVTLDILPPSGGSISYSDGVTSNPVSLTLSSGSDLGSGVNLSRILRRNASLSGDSCGSYGTWHAIANNPGSSYQDTVNESQCYQYRHEVFDFVNNGVNYTSGNTAKVGSTPNLLNVTVDVTSVTVTEQATFTADWDCYNCTIKLLMDTEAEFTNCDYNTASGCLCNSSGETSTSNISTCSYTFKSGDSSNFVWFGKICNNLNVCDNTIKYDYLFLENKNAFEKNGSAVDPWDYDNEANTTEYGEINRSENIRWRTWYYSNDTTDGDSYDSQIYAVNISETEPPNITPYWEGYGEKNSTGFYTNLSIWNWSNYEWFHLDSKDFTVEGDDVLTNTISVNATDFINSTINQIVFRIITRKYIP